MTVQTQFYTTKTEYRPKTAAVKNSKLKPVQQPSDFETLKQQRQAKQRQKKIALFKRRFQFVAITIVVFFLAIAVGIAGYRKKQRNEIYLEKIALLEQEIAKEEKKQEDLVEYNKYVQTDRYIEEVAREKLGLVMPDEVIFKPKED